MKKKKEGGTRKMLRGRIARSTKGLGLRDEGFGFKVEGLGLRVQGARSSW